MSFVEEREKKKKERKEIRRKQLPVVSMIVV